MPHPGEDLNERVRELSAFAQGAVRQFHGFGQQREVALDFSRSERHAAVVPIQPWTFGFMGVLALVAVALGIRLFIRATRMKREDRD